MPKISVVMPVYNGEKYLKEAIDSIQNQTFSDFELIIINDCSTDGTESIIMSYKDNRIVYIKNEKNLGVAKSLNKGFDIAKGEYIVRMDADDISFPYRFKKQIEYMDSNPKVGVCGGALIIFGDEEEKKYVYSKHDAEIRVDMIFSPAFAHPAVMIRNSILQKYNLRYNPEFEKAEDYKMWYDILSVSEGHNLQECILKYRHHNKQVSNTCVEEQNIAMEKMRRLMYGTLNLHTDKYYDIFCRICMGDRMFIDECYDELYQFLKIVIKNNTKYNKKYFRRVWSAINYSVNKCATPKTHRFLTVFELLLFLKSIFKGE